MELTEEMRVVIISEYHKRVMEWLMDATLFPVLYCIALYRAVFLIPFLV